MVIARRLVIACSLLVEKVDASSCLAGLRSRNENGAAWRAARKRKEEETTHDGWGETRTRENEWLVGMEEKGTWRRYAERKERKRVVLCLVPGS